MRERLLLVFMIRIRMRIGAMRVLGAHCILASIRIARANGAMSHCARTPCVSSRGMARWHRRGWHVSSIRGRHGAFTSSSVLIGAASSRCREGLRKGWIVRESLRTRGSRMRRALTRLIRHVALRTHRRGRTACLRRMNGSFVRDRRRFWRLLCTRTRRHCAAGACLVKGKNIIMPGQSLSSCIVVRLKCG